jgi:hypothetical protein
MLTLIAAAAMAAQTPAAPPPADPQGQHMQMGEHAQHKAMDCCKDCCDDKAAEHDGDEAEHAEHGAAK